MNPPETTLTLPTFASALKKVEAFCLTKGFYLPKFSKPHKMFLVKNSNIFLRTRSVDTLAKDQGIPRSICMAILNGRGFFDLVPSFPNIDPIPFHSSH